MRATSKLLTTLAVLGGAYYVAKALVHQTRHFPWQGKVAIVTGGSRGLGIVLARELVKRGVRVAICARTQEDVDLATNELQALGGEVIGLACDVRDEWQVRGFAHAVLHRWGTIDLLFNVAGVMQVGPIEAMTVDDFREAMDINCFGALHTSLAVLPTMKRRGWGRIVNVASIGGKRAVPHMIPYDMSKFALVGLSNGLRTELFKDNILVTTACPSLMRTGSPRNATFKGRHREEYAWFSIGGSLPLAAVSAESAAAQILSACQNGAGEVYICNTFSPPVWASQLAPTLTNEILALINRLLPSMGGIGQHAAFGYESESELSPSLLTSLGDAAAKRNNEMRRRESSRLHGDGFNHN